MIVSNIYASLHRFCAEFAEAQTGMQVINFDAHADDSTVPLCDVLGATEVSIDVADSVVGVSLQIGLSTLNDTNLFRLNTLVGKMFEELLPTKRIPLFDADSGEEIGWLVIQNGTKMLPVGGSVGRPLQFIGVSLLSSVTVKL